MVALYFFLLLLSYLIYEHSAYLSLSCSFVLFLACNFIFFFFTFAGFLLPFTRIGEENPPRTKNGSRCCMLASRVLNKTDEEEEEKGKTVMGSRLLQ